MDFPPSTQPSESLPTLFQKADGSALQIYVEASNIQGRPQLIRSMKKRGANICFDPKSAQILLVDPGSTQGRLFIRNWGNDEDKIVLNYVWAKRCIDAGKALLEDDQYGDCRTYDDGLPIGDDEDDGDELEQPVATKSPLPTPRQTPIEPVKVHHEGQDRRYPGLDQQVAKRRSSTNPQSRASSTFADPGPSTTNALPLSIPPTMNGMNFAGLGVPTMPQVPTVLSQQQAAAAAMIAQQTQAAMIQLSQSGLPFPGQSQLPLTDPFWLSMKDNIIMNLMQSQQLAASMQPGAYAQSMQNIPKSPVEEQALPFPSIPTPNTSTPRFVDAPPKAKSKSKQRAASPSSKRRKTSSHSFQESSTSQHTPNGSKMNHSSKGIFTTSYGKQLTFYVQIAGHNRFNLVQSIKRNGGLIVNNIEDANYVILFPAAKTDKAHDNYLRLAKSAKVPVLNPRFINDCVEDNALLDHSAYYFEPLKKKRKRPASPGPSRASPFEPESEDESDSALPPPVEQETEEEEKERKRQEKCARERQRRKAIREKQAAESQAYSQPHQTPNGHSYKASPSVPTSSTRNASQKRRFSGDVASPIGARSPTPPAMHTQVMHSMGFKFTPEEDEFAIRYAQVLLDRDHEISATAVATCIHKKLPHHTLKSWRTHFQALTANLFDDWRKRAGIKYRKAQNANARKQAGAGALTSAMPSMELESDIEDPPPSVTSPSPASSFRISPEVAHKMLEDDLNAIARFFAEGNDDQTETEDVIWARLTAQTRCKTEPHWDEFYQKHSDEVQARYQTLVDEQN